MLTDVALVQTRGWRADDEEMQRFVPIEDLFKERHFDQQIIVLCVSWYTSFKPSLLDLGDDPPPENFEITPVVTHEA